MTELVERYVHQVGRYLPPKSRSEIEAELSSQIYDQLEDRFAQSPTQEEVVAVLAEFGNPYQIATSYNSDQYLVGPSLYPFMIRVLRHVWVLVPTIVIFLSIFGALVSSQQTGLITLLVETVGSTVQATLIFSAVVVLIFAIIERLSDKLDLKKEPFNPLNLPKVDDPGVVDWYEAAFGLVIGTIVVAILLYFLRVGGLTLHFNLNDPGDMIPFPTGWMLVLLLTIVGEVILQVWAMWQKSWGVGSWLLETVFEVLGSIALYFAVFEPVVQRIITDNPTLTNTTLISSLPEIAAALLAVFTLAVRGSKLLTLWNYRNSDTPHLTKLQRRE